MNVPRSKVSAALLALFAPLLKTNGGAFEVVSRAPAIGQQTPPPDQPCLFLIKIEEGVSRPAHGLSKYLLRYMAAVYFRGDAEDRAIAQTQMDDLLDPIDAALKPKPPHEAQRLGGLVTDCYIEGSILFEGGILDEQCAFGVPIVVVTGE